MTSADRTSNVNAPTPLDWQDLIASARRSIADQPLEESRAANHRAVSTAYYATYDALCASNAAVLVPNVTDQASADAWVRVYRGSSHGHAVGNLQRHSASLSPDGQDFAAALEDLYDARPRADYNPKSVFNQRDARMDAIYRDTSSRIDKVFWAVVGVGVVVGGGIIGALFTIAL